MKRRFVSLVLCILLLITCSPVIMAGTNDFPKGNIDAPKNISVSIKSSDNSTISGYTLDFSIPGTIPALNTEWASWNKSNNAENMSINLEYDYKLNEAGSWHYTGFWDFPDGAPESFKLANIGVAGEVNIKPATLSDISNEMSMLNKNTVYFRCRFTVTFYDKVNGVTVKSVSPWSESTAAKKDVASGVLTKGQSGNAVTDNVTEGLVARYCFDGNLNDSTTVNNGVQIGNISYVGGLSGSAASFDGKSYIEVGSNNSLNLTDKFSLSVWLYKDYDNNGSVVPIVQKLGSESTRDVEPYTLSEYLMYPRFTFVSDDKWDYLNCTHYVDMHKWQLLTVTYDGSEMKYYINGELTDALQYPSALAVSDGKLVIGKMTQPEGTLFYKGYMDDLRIYNKTLDYGQVKAIYAGMADNSGKDLINHPNKLVAWYKLNGDIKDSSGFKNDAKFIGSGSPAFVDALQGKGLVFNGNSYLEIADNDPQELDKAFTFSVWASTVKKNDINDDSFPIFSKAKSSNYPLIPAYQLQYRHLSGNNERIDFYGMDQSSSSPSNEIEQDFPSDYKTWKMITVTNDGVNTKVYVNGKFISSSDYTAPLLHSGGKLYIGKSSYESETNVFFKGSMDELRIYNYALNETEITKLYNYRDSLVVTDAKGLKALKKGGKTLKLKVSLVPPEKTPVTDITAKVKYTSSNTRAFTVANNTLTIKGKGNGNLTVTFGPLSAVIPVIVK